MQHSVQHSIQRCSLSDPVLGAADATERMKKHVQPYPACPTYCPAKANPYPLHFVGVAGEGISTHAENHFGVDACSAVENIVRNANDPAEMVSSILRANIPVYSKIVHQWTLDEMLDFLYFKKQELLMSDLPLHDLCGLTVCMDVDFRPFPGETADEKKIGTLRAELQGLIAQPETDEEEMYVAKTRLFGAERFILHFPFQPVELVVGPDLATVCRRMQALRRVRSWDPIDMKGLILDGSGAGSQLVLQVRTERSFMVLASCPGRSSKHRAACAMMATLLSGREIFEFFEQCGVGLGALPLMDCVRDGSLRAPQLAPSRARQRSSEVRVQTSPALVPADRGVSTPTKKRSQVPDSLSVLLPSVKGAAPRDQPVAAADGQLGKGAPRCKTREASPQTMLTTKGTRIYAGELDRRIQDWLPGVLTGFEPELVRGFAGRLQAEGFLCVRDLVMARALGQLTTEFLANMGIGMGHRNRILAALPAPGDD